MPTVDSLTDVFTSATVSDMAYGYATAFHAGTAAVAAVIGRALLAKRHQGPERLTEALLSLVAMGSKQ